jgi:hypothetical protein
MTRLLFVISAVLTLTGCGELFADLVKQPRSAVVNMIYNMPADANLMRLPERLPNARMRVATGPDGVVWTYALAGKDVCTFTAHVKEETADTAVVWTDSDDISADGRRLLCDAVRIAGEESVAATLAGRPANRKLVESQLAAAMVGNIGEVHRTIGEEINRLAPEDTECYEEKNAGMRQACRTREFNREHDRQQGGATLP